ncbi:DUF763 domain-containing protein [Candidatus Shapirobacteria bacterium CG10_big_fil_rev_8_21_14_0_10_40_9]|uniref:DUF763 domain-containing protein n=1 Tax=Candidatus Shapirobacteria bacterium CG10_big_fil_rev_8_21_14_0_10_40_9 TaxID=1974888 RepID=A0A2M8L3U4_9BACT|nr:MAG: DUF763 domain-containing protein [Candidatus Shapirobacteria bacterium CG10_big_fil_rev_8_21_14_0_10_40_9]
MKTGTASLPLHFGSTPAWLFEMMTKLAREITIAIVLEHGTDQFLVKLSDPAWFQSFGCVLGFDWHSSGLTTTTCGALKEGLRPLQKDLGFFICGGKGKTSRKTPEEIKRIGEWYHVTLHDTNHLIYASRIAAKVDNNALQDGYQLYHHTFFFTPKGKWAVVQQGMNAQSHWARRYHWLSDNVRDFVCEPHSGIASETRGIVMNLVARESDKARKVTAKLASEKPEKTIKEIKKLRNLKLDPHHEVLISDINPENLEKIFLSTYQNQPENFEKLLGMKGVGPKTIRALALISELIYKIPYSIRDPATYSFAHGGKDGTPYPVDQKTYEQSISILAQAIKRARLGYYEKLHCLRRLC